MAESTKFKKGYKNIPSYVFVEIQSGIKQEVQIYDIRVLLTARFGGLRWLMYNYRIASFVAFVGAFWFAEIMSSALSWVIFRSFFSSSESPIKEVMKDDTKNWSLKTENETDDPDLSDTPRTFPTYGRQAPLRYVPKVKDEDLDDYVIDETIVQPLAAEADDESEDFGGKDGRTDSGIGTSFSEGGERGLSRRRSRGGNSRT